MCKGVKLRLAKMEEKGYMEGSHMRQPIVAFAEYVVCESNKHELQLSAQSSQTKSNESRE
jgi:hypothetical protein